LTVTAAIGLVVVQISAIVFHVARSEQTRLPVNAVLLLMAALIVVGRVAIIPVA
jgi:DoxX-like family